MFGVSFSELIVIVFVALIVLGPDKLPEVARQLGRLLFELKKASESAKREFCNALYEPAKEDSKLNKPLPIRPEAGVETEPEEPKARKSEV